MYENLLLNKPLTFMNIIAVILTSKFVSVNLVHFTKILEKFFNISKELLTFLKRI